MKEHVGDEYEGTISGIIGKGLFVSITDLLIEGMVLSAEAKAKRDKSLGGDPEPLKEKVGEPVKLSNVIVGLILRIKLLIILFIFSENDSFSINKLEPNLLIKPDNDSV